MPRNAILGIALLVLLAAAFAGGAWWKSGDVSAHEKQIEAERKAIRAELDGEKDARAKAEYALGKAQEGTRKAEKERDTARTAAAMANETLRKIKASPPLPMDKVALNLERYGLRPQMVSGLIAFDELDGNNILIAYKERGACFDALFAEKELSVAQDGVIATLKAQVSAYVDKEASWERTELAYERGKEVLEADTAFWKEEASKANRRVWLWKAVALGAGGLAIYSAATN